MKIIDNSFARTSQLSISYIEIAVDHYLNFLDSLKKLEDLENRKNEMDQFKYEEHYHILDDSIDRNYVISVIFSSMFMESYIYDFGARNTTDAYMTKYFDKLDTVSKWVVIPKVISGTEIERSKKSFEILKKLISTRNRLIHWKSKNAKTTDTLKHSQKELYHLLDLKEVFISIKDLFKQLDEGQEIKIHNFYIKYIEEKIICG